jgi:hypothetical protein
MDTESWRMHRRGAVVAIVGILLGTLCQASLVDSANRRRSPHFLNPTVIVVRPVPAYDARAYKTPRSRETLTADAGAASN